MASPLVPVVAIGAIAYVNNAYNKGFAGSSLTDVKPLLGAGVAGLLLDAAAEIPGMGPAAALLGWTALVGMLIGPVQKPSPMDNLLKIVHTAKGS